MNWTRLAFVSIGIAVSGCAATPPHIWPVPDPSQQVRYERGVGSVHSSKKLGVVEITPRGYDDGRVAFDVAVYNKSSAPANFGPEYISVLQNDSLPGRLVTVGDLEHEAEVHAAWQKAGMIMVGVLSAAAASQSAYSTTHTTVYTPHGSVAVTSRTYDPAVAYEAGRDAGAMTGNGLAAIQESLDRTREGIHDSLLQTTTLAPGDSYGGIAIVDKFESSKLPEMVSLQVNWNGEDHLFRFAIADGEYTVPQQTSTPPAPEPQPVPSSAAITAEPSLPLGHVSPQPVPSTVALTAERALPLGHVSQAEAAYENSAPAEPSAAVSFSEWQQEHPTKAQPKSRTGITITGGVN